MAAIIFVLVFAVAFAVECIALAMKQIRGDDGPDAAMIVFFTFGAVSGSVVAYGALMIALQPMFWI